MPQLLRLPIRHLPVIGWSLVAAFLTACASAPIRQGGTLSSYSRLQPGNGIVTKTMYFVDKPALASARTVRIEPTSVGGGSAGANARPQDLRLVGNAIDRSLCIGLSDRFTVVGRDAPADLVVHATTTAIQPTSAAISGLSTVASLGAGAVTAVPVPRLPAGLGGLAVEGEARNMAGSQVGAIVWARGANILTEPARISPVGDAYALASNFGDDFATMLTKGGSPMDGDWIASGQKIRSMLGGRHKYPACDAFGRSPGVVGFVEGQFGMPPQWADKAGATAKTGS